MATNYKEEIRQSTTILLKFRKSAELFAKEKEILGLEQQRYDLYYHQVHSFLAPLRESWAETEIREHIKDIVRYDLPVCESKIDRFRNAIPIYEKRGQNDNIELCYKYLQDWLGLYEYFYALVDFRSFEHFGLYMEWDVPEKDRVWKPSLDPYGDGGYTGVSKPFFYYFNQMVLKKDIKFISKQMFTGGGKSRSNQFAFAWLLGIDKDNDILDVLGNPALVLTNTRGTVELIKNVRFVKVFPEYSKYLVQTMGKDGKSTYVVSDNIFSTCRIKEGELTLADSNKPMNLKVISKDTPVDGIRVKFLFLDDVCRSKDANNLKMHQTDIENFWNSWFKRNYGTDDFYIVVSGTAYSVMDIMSHLIAYYSKGKMQRTSINKYTYASLDHHCIFIKIPKIDDEFERSTYPQKFPYEEAVRARERNLATFLAMEQQQPQNPETSPLAYEKLNTYDVLPEGLSDYAIALIDPARSGKNYVSMPIHRVKKEIDKFNQPIERHYLVDALFQMRVMEDLYGQICDMVEKHHIIRLHVENNTDTSLRYLLESKLHERQIFFCEVTESYSTENKENKMNEIVYSNEGYFRNQMVYPSMSVFAPSSQVGKFMLYMTAFDYQKKLEYDDSIDSECMYIERFVAKKKQTAKAKLLYI